MAFNQPDPQQQHTTIAQQNDLQFPDPARNPHQSPQKLDNGNRMTDKNPQRHLVSIQEKLQEVKKEVKKQLEQFEPNEVEEEHTATIKGISDCVSDLVSHLKLLSKMQEEALIQKAQTVSRSLSPPNGSR